MAQLNLTLNHEEIQEVFSEGSLEVLSRLLERTINEIPKRSLRNSCMQSVMNVLKRESTRATASINTV